MRSRAKTLAVITATLLLASVVVYRSSDHCNISQSTARNMVLAELQRKGFDPRFMGPIVRDSGDCSYDIHYEGAGQKIDYAVYDDPMHGLELGTWDFNRPGNGP